MKKRRILVGILASLSLVSCGKEEALPPAVTVPPTESVVVPPVVPEVLPEPEAQLEEFVWAGDTLFYLAFLGYGTADDYVAQGEAVTEAYFSYPYQHKVYDFSGDEVYLFLPRFVDSEIYVYESVFAEDDLVKGDLREIICWEDYFLLQCNVSDIYSNVILEMEYQGEMISFSPSISLKDGSLQQSDYWKDVTDYTWFDQ